MLETSVQMGGVVYHVKFVDARILPDKSFHVDADKHVIRVKLFELELDRLRALSAAISSLNQKLSRIPESPTHSELPPGVRLLKIQPVNQNEPLRYPQSAQA